MNDKRQFLPTLLERLIDEEPRKKTEAPNAISFDAKKMREIVRKDLTMLLNSSNIEDVLNKKEKKWIAESVLNYGIAPLVGSYANQYSWRDIEKVIRDAILRFEPRIIPESLLVLQSFDQVRLLKNSVMHFEIRGLIKWQPFPIDLCFSGFYDSETEQVELNNA